MIVWNHASPWGHRLRLAMVPAVSGSEVAWIVGLALVYLGTAKLALQLAFVHASATVVWPPTGIAMAVLLARGLRLWPGILLGAFTANILTAGTLWTSLGIASGNTLESVAAVILVLRFARGPLAFEAPRNVFRFVLLAGFASTTISPTIGISALCLGGYAAWHEFGTIWWTWWLGDLTGAVLLAPPLILWLTQWSPRWRWKPSVEGLGLTLWALGTTALLFGDSPWHDGLGLPLSFLCLPPLIGVAFHFRALEASTIVVLMSALAIGGTLRGFGPFALETPHLSLQLLQAFLGTLAVMTLLLVSVVSQRRRSLYRLQQVQGELEQRVAERTEALSQSMSALQDEVDRREKAQSQLAESEHNLAKAQSVAHLGSWHWNLQSNRISWSDEMFRIFGIEPGPYEMDYTFFLDRVHPEDRAFVEATIQRASSVGGSFGFEHRIVGADGKVRWLHGLGEARVRGEESPWMHGTARDITESKRFEGQRRRLELELLDLTYREQSQLGKDLQDDLGQLLAGIAFRSKRVERSFSARALPETAQMAEIGALVELAIGKTRSLARVLVSADVVEGNLPVALQTLAANTEKLFAIPCRFHDRSEAAVPEEGLLAAHLYRIAQEAVSNAVRHGQATRIAIELHKAPEGELRLQIQDNGSGFADDASMKVGFGMRIMQRRSELMGGILEIHPSRQGTTVTCRIEMRPTAASEAQAATPPRSPFSAPPPA